jgi:hypothetical protein
MASIAQNTTIANTEENLEEEISNNEISNNKLISTIQKTLGNNANSLTKEQLKELCNLLTISKMAKNTYNNMISKKQINKLNDGSICVNVKGEPFRKFNNEKDLKIFISKQIKNKLAEKSNKASDLYVNILSNNIQVNKLNQLIKNCDKNIEAKVKESDRLSNELFKNTQMYKELQDTSLKAKHDLANIANNFEDRKIRLAELANNQGIRSDNDINSQLNRYQQQKNNDQQIRALEAATNAQITAANKNTNAIIDNNNNNTQALFNQLQQNNKNAEKFADSILAGINNLNSNLNSSLNGLASGLANLNENNNKLKNSFENLNNTMNGLNDKLEDLENNKNMDKILDNYTHPCSADYCWYKHTNGNFICGGGSHYLTMDELKQAMKEGRKANEINVPGGVSRYGKVGQCIGSGRP